MPTLLYALLCLTLPLLWGIVTARVFDRLEAKRRASHSSEEDAVVMYEI